MTNQLDKRQPDFAFPSAYPLFLTLGFLKVHDLFKLKLAMFVYKSLNKHTPTNFHSWFKLTTQTHSHNTRSKYLLGSPSGNCVWELVSLQCEFLIYFRYMYVYCYV